jgi:prevent-host-death family protein
VARTQINLYEAKTQLSSLVERAAKGEEIVIAKAGKPIAKLSAIAKETNKQARFRAYGKDLLGITFLSDDWEQDIPLEYLEDPEGEHLFTVDPVVVKAK